MMPHLRYLGYVLRHKIAVFLAGWAMRDLVTAHPLRWAWRLFVHDLSKFGRAEWGPYVAMFYRSIERDVAAQAVAWRAISEEDGPMSAFAEQGHAEAVAKYRVDLKRDRQAQFNAAWLHHIHCNPHHWQHWILHEDSGKVLLLIPDASYADEMVADWLGAGPKASITMPMQERVAMTIVWYAQNVAHMQLRNVVRSRVEGLLMELATAYGVRDAAQEIESARRTRASIVIPGR